MKDIKNMNLAELADQIERKLDVPMGEDLVQYDIADRLYAIHDLTRWIPVSERMPTEKDGYKSKYVTQRTVLVMEKWGDISVVTIGLAKHFTHWKRIDKPEGV
jgi:hypothetical protein